MALISKDMISEDSGVLVIVAGKVSAFWVSEKVRGQTCFSMKVSIKPKPGLIIFLKHLLGQRLGSQEYFFHLAFVHSLVKEGLVHTNQFLADHHRWDSSRFTHVPPSVYVCFFLSAVY